MSIQQVRPDDWRGIGEFLTDEGAITAKQLDDALAEQRDDQGGRRLGRILRDRGLIDEFDIASAIARQLGLQRVNLLDRPLPEPAVIDLVPRRVADAHSLLPLDFDDDAGQLLIAMADPTNVLALDDLLTHPSVRDVTVMVAPETSVVQRITAAYGRDTAELAVQQVDPNEEADEPRLGDGEDRDEPVVRLVDSILLAAAQTRASDLHIEPDRHGMRVRARIDGILREIQRIPDELRPAVTSRLKVLADMDIAEKRQPQDGSASFQVGDSQIDLRVSTMPSTHGETIALRLLGKSAEKKHIDELGFSTAQQDMFLRTLNQTQGLILMTGPTGSGKTTSLRAAMAALAGPSRKIVTLEDPVEYRIDDVNQTEVQPKIGLTFARGLRSLLRQDPDVIMVGEIRDAETAELAVKAAFTGHLVLSTLHTDDAPSAILRLADLGIERFQLARTLKLVVAQRLVRRVCPGCAEAYMPDDTVLDQLLSDRAMLQGATPRRGSGCERCSNTGFNGRTGVHEMLHVTPRMRELIGEGSRELQIAAQARADGLMPLRREATRKARDGSTTFEEVLRVTPEDPFLEELGTSGENRGQRSRPGASDPSDVLDPAVSAGAIPSARLLAAGDRELLVEARHALPPGWTMSTATSVRETLSRVRTEHTDLMLLDHEFRDGTALDVLRPLRESDRDFTPAVIRQRSRAGADEDLTAWPTLVATDHIGGEPDAVELQRRLGAALRR